MRNSCVRSENNQQSSRGAQAEALAAAAVDEILSGLPI